MVSSKKSTFANFSKLRNCSKRHSIPQITQVRLKRFFYDDMINSVTFAPHRA